MNSLSQNLPQRRSRGPDTPMQARGWGPRMVHAQQVVALPPPHLAYYRRSGRTEHLYATDGSSATTISCRYRSGRTKHFATDGSSAPTTSFVYLGSTAISSKRSSENRMTAKNRSVVRGASGACCFALRSLGETKQRRKLYGVVILSFGKEQ